MVPGDIVTQRITFADTEEGQKAQRDFMLTGRLPDDMTGVAQVQVTHLTWGGASITHTAHYSNGLPTASEQVIFRDGTAVMRIAHVHDAEGEIVPAATEYTFQATPRDEAEARKLNMLLHGSPEGPISAGETYTITVGSAQMAELHNADPAWSGGATEPVTGVLEGMSEDDLYAVHIATDPGSDWLAGLTRAQQHAGTHGSPLDAEVTDSTGQHVEP